MNKSKQGLNPSSDPDADKITMKDDRFTADTDEEDSAQEGPSEETAQERIKTKKHGIIYISSIPKYMTVSILREFLSEHAKVGRIYLQARSSGQKSAKDEGKIRSTCHSFT